MFLTNRRILSALGAVVLAAVGTLGVATSAQARASYGAAGTVYTESNAAAGNAILALARDAQGNLTPLGTYPTGGLGTGGGIDPLQSQYALVLDASGRWLYAVNAGSNTITSFARSQDGSLARRATVFSGGQRPVSLAVHDDLLYVLNNGGTTDNNHGIGNIVGFRRGADGALVPLSDGTLPVSGADVGASTIAFSRDGRYLLVTERAANRLALYTVGPDGSASGPAVSSAAAGAPFGFGFGNDDVAVVSEAAAAAVSTYQVQDAQLAPVQTLGTNAVAPCWAIVTPSGRFAYVANAGSGLLTGYGVTPTGALTPLASSPTSTGAGSTPIDVETSHEGRWLFTLNTGTGTIGEFAIGGDGALAPAATATAFPARSSYQGLAVW